MELQPHNPDDRDGDIPEHEGLPADDAEAMAKKERIEGIVGEECKNLSLEERARLTERLGQHFVQSLIRMDRHSRDDEVSLLEDWSRREAPLLKRDRDAINEHLLLRRAELEARGEEFSEIQQAITRGRQDEVARMLQAVKEYLETEDSLTAKTEDVLHHILNHIAARQQAIKGQTPKVGDE
jgi:hypothetical protein